MKEHVIDIEDAEHVTFTEGFAFCDVMLSDWTDEQAAVHIDNDLTKTDVLVVKSAGVELFRGYVTGFDLGSELQIYARHVLDLFDEDLVDTAVAEVCVAEKSAPTISAKSPNF
jgi:hypothetical protein